MLSKKFKLSVVIPVFNASKYLNECVISVLKQPEVFEIVLVEDKSEDNSLAICKELANDHPSVKLYQHSGAENRGAGASRNLGIEKASGDLISFLDADDFYGENRFQTAIDIFSRKPDVDGVYEAVAFFHDHLDIADYKLYTVTKAIAPEKLYRYLASGKYGHFHTNGIVVKKSLLEKAGGFDISLRLHQDQELWQRLAFYGNLVAGKIDQPVAYYRKHAENRFKKANYQTHLQSASKMLEFAYKQKQIRFIEYALIFKKFLTIKAAAQNSSFIATATKEMANNPRYYGKLLTSVFFLKRNSVSNMNFKKIFFFYGQLSTLEFFTVVGHFLFGKKNLSGSQRKRETIKFIEERFKDGRTVRRDGKYICVTETIERIDRTLWLRRFTSDVMVYNQIMLKREFEPIVKIFRARNFTPVNCIDAGANIGLTTVYLKSKYPSLSIVAVEPNESNFQSLEKNVSGNNLSGCKLLKMGLWSSQMNLTARNEPNQKEELEWGFAVKAAADSASGSIAGVTIDELMRQNGWANIDFLKIDIEGAEEEIFAKEESYDAFLKVTKSLSLEVHDVEFEKKIVHMLERRGYEVSKFGELVFGIHRTLV
jgi:FkbM family methyltransferase